jgi:hypothetical protein
MLHRTRHMFIRQQTALINSIRAPSAGKARTAEPAALKSDFLSSPESGLKSASKRTTTDTPARPLPTQGNDQRPARHIGQDQRARGPERRAHVMGLRSEIGREMQEPRYDVAVQEQPARQ